MTVRIILLGILGAMLAAGCGRLEFQQVTSTDGSLTDGSSMDGTSVAPWRLVQVNGVAGPSLPASLSVNLSAVGADHLLVVGMQFGIGSPVSGVQDNAPGGSSTYLEIPATKATNNAIDQLELWYSPAAHAGATAVTVTSGDTNAVVAWEFATARPVTVDTSGQLSNQTSTAMPFAPTIATQQTAELVIAAAVTELNVTNIHPGDEFTNDSIANGNGWAHITATDPPATTHTAEWDSGSGTFCSDAVAFYIGP